MNPIVHYHGAYYHTSLFDRALHYYVKRHEDEDDDGEWYEAAARCDDIESIRISPYIYASSKRAHRWLDGFMKRVVIPYFEHRLYQPNGAGAIASKDDFETRMIETSKSQARGGADSH